MSASFRSLAAASLLLIVPSLILAAAKAKPEKAKDEPKAAAKGAASSTKLAGSLLKTFKLWDKNKDEAVDKEELEKFYARLKAKPKKKGDAADAGGDPFAPVTALLTKADADADGKISKTEFEEWASSFAQYAAKILELQVKRAGIERERANLEALAAKSGNVTAGDGIFQQEARKGLIFYKQSIEEIDGQIKELQAGGHAEYAELLMPQLGR